MPEAAPEREWTAEKFASRVFDVGLLDTPQIDSVWAELGTRDASLEDLTSCMIRKGLLTNLQIDRVMNGERYGYFYGKYKLMYLVGAGTFARVYRGAHVDNNETVAIKVLRNRHSSDIVQQDHFLREANMVKELRHPNIVPVYDFGSERERYYMVMEFVEGDNLREILKKRGKFNVQESLKIITDVVSGLDFAVGKGVTHRDLKLSNVLLTSTGRGKLVDFGLAAMAENEKERNAKDRAAGVTTTSGRSIDYAGLERVTGVRKNDKRSDVFFAGCMFYQLLTGVPPLSEARERSQRLSATRFRDVKPIVQHDPDLPSAVVAVVNKAMDLDPEKRYQTPGDFLADLHRLTQRLEEGESAEGETKKLEREGEGHSVMIVESNIEMQDTLRDLLKRRGYRVLIVGDADRAVSRFDSVERPAECVVFCTTEMGEEAFDAFNAFGENEDTKDIPSILLLSERYQDFAGQAATAEHRVLIRMPLKVRQLRSLLLKLLTRAAKSAEA